METKYTLIENTYIDNSDAIDLANANLSVGKDANEDITIICNNGEFIEDESGDCHIDTTNFKAVEFAKMGETLVSNKISDSDLEMLFELFDANEENIMNEDRNLESMYMLKEYDAQTRAFIDEVFQMVATECKWHCLDDLELEIDEETKFVFCNTKEYMDTVKKIYGREGDRGNLMSYGRNYNDIEDDWRKVVMIHGSEFNIGMMNWMSDFKQFEKLANTIMELAASGQGIEYVIRDHDFAKEQFEMVQQMVQKRKAA